VTARLLETTLKRFERTIYTREEKEKQGDYDITLQQAQVHNGRS